MKTLRKITIAFALAALTANLILTACLFARPQTPNETGFRYEYAERVGNLDDVGTLFLTPDGNLYSIDAQYPNAEGTAFLLRLDGHGTADKTDDEILEVWDMPTAY